MANPQPVKPATPLNQPAAPKTDGIKVRGTGAATKGTRARGPMA